METNQNTEKSTQPQNTAQQTAPNTANTATQPAAAASSEKSAVVTTTGDSKPVKDTKKSKFSGGRKKKKKKKFIVLIIIAVIVLLLFVVPNFFSSSEEAADGITDSDLTTLSFTDFKSTIGGSGTVHSDVEFTVQTTVTNSTIDTILVDVGDTVQVGDSLIQLDTTSLQQDLVEKQKAYDTQAQLNAINIQSAQDAYDRAVTARNNGTNSSIVTAANSLQQARNAYNDAVKAHSDKVTAISNNTNLITSKSTMTALEQELNNARNNVVNIINSQTSTQEEKDAAQQALDRENRGEIPVVKPSGGTVIELYEIKLYDYNIVKKNYESLYNSEHETLANLASAMESARLSLSTSETSYNKTVSDVNIEIDSLLKTLETTKLNADQTAALNDIQDIQTNIENSTVKAARAGVITAVNAKEGASPTGDLMTISDEYSLIIESKVGEYDVNSIYSGMAVEITSNSTGDEEFTGTVVSVAPSPTVATATNESSTPKAEYTVKIAITSDIGSLKLGMNTRINFITEQRSGVLTAPLDCIFEDENGVSNVLVYTETDMGTHELTPYPVELGSESDFEQVISGANIVEGLVIVNNAADHYNPYGLLAMEDETAEGGMAVTMGPGPMASVTARAIGG